MELEKVLKLVHRNWHDDIRGFLKTGYLPSDEFADYVNTDIFCQAALSVIIDYEHRVLNELARARVLRAFLDAVDPAHRDAALCFALTTEYTKEFRAYLEADPKAVEALGRYVIDFQRLSAAEEEEQPTERDEQADQSPAKMFADELQKIHRRWLHEEFGT